MFFIYSCHPVKHIYLFVLLHQNHAFTYSITATYIIFVHCIIAAHLKRMYNSLYHSNTCFFWIDVEMPHKFLRKFLHEYPIVACLPLDAARTIQNNSQVHHTWVIIYNIHTYITHSASSLHTLLFVDLEYEYRYDFLLKRGHDFMLYLILLTKFGHSSV